MTSPYASSAHAWGLCDRCGFRYKLSQLQYEVYDRRPNGLRVCAECLDDDNPQLWLGEVIVDDPQSLQDPRPDIDKQPSTTYFGWAPVGSPLFDMQAQGEVGTATVLIT